MEGDDGGTTYRNNWDISGTKHAGEIKLEKNRGNQIEVGRGSAGNRRRVISRPSLYGFPEIRTGLKLQSQYSQGTLFGRGDEI
eukprot:7768644-Heterocapsa_arctica.AAC.1